MSFLSRESFWEQENLSPVHKFVKRRVFWGKKGSNLRELQAEWAIFSLYIRSKQRPLVVVALCGAVVLGLARPFAGCHFVNVCACGRRLGYSPFLFGRLHRSGFGSKRTEIGRSRRYFDLYWTASLLLAQSCACAYSQTWWSFAHA